MDLKDYRLSDGLYDELVTQSGRGRIGFGELSKFLRKSDAASLNQKKAAAELAIKTLGISFTVYSDGENIDRQWPFDIIPRLIQEAEWRRIESGLKQRLKALNCFITDVYNGRNIIKDGIVPGDIIQSSKDYRPECEGMRPKFDVWAHICGTDLIRDADGTVYVLEDNLRVPSGVSYMLENRNISKRIMPELIERHGVLPMDDYPSQLFDTLCSISPRAIKSPEVVLLTPGTFNSAYFEHAFLAQRMGVELVEGADLMVDSDDFVYMKTVEGPAKVDVIYRRIDDQFLDPEVFRADSMLGVPGLMRAWRAGHVAIANAPGVGVADDKVVYTYVPAMIRYYLSEEPILPNVPSYLCSDPDQRQFVLENLRDLVVKPANESGGYGMYIGPRETEKFTGKMRKQIVKNPRNYMAQPIISLSTVPTWIDDKLDPRHVDLRPFILQGKHNYVTAGGLTRVALVKGSLVVNSSQGGGSKDTWIVRTNVAEATARVV
ncbi:MAG: circularly permuted type 2 ATP-grasp protein [Proteobacteria bacterium]|nr:circularly permuted type 2 ATP-grasp protein [Pseudomonadota bacterium]